MALFTFNISGAVSKPYLLSNTYVNNCFSETDIEVKVFGGIRYVTIISTGPGANMSISESISSDKIYSLSIEGSNTSNLINTSRITVTIRDTTSTGTILGTYTLTRKHNSNYC